MNWEVIDTGPSSACENMRLDTELLEGLSSQSRPILHLYEWKWPSATFGHFVDPADYLNLEAAQSLGLELAQRPTGGGIIFHLWDFAFSALVPATHPAFSTNTLENYALINQAVLRAVQAFLGTMVPLDLTPSDGVSYDASSQRFCMAKPTKYDVMLGAKKIAGAAQRKTKSGFLHQGSISLTMPDSVFLKKVLTQGTRVAEAMQAHTFALLGSTACEDQMRAARKELGALLRDALNNGREE